ncbi:MAG: hypothetical protein M0P71_00705 [Melioribacteraceae bacterium]|nr:hypothetical protein [Melioribacteraceae bacterium]
MVDFLTVYIWMTIAFITLVILSFNHCMIGRYLLVTSMLLFGTIMIMILSIINIIESIIHALFFHKYWIETSRIKKEHLNRLEREIAFYNKLGCHVHHYHPSVFLSHYVRTELYYNMFRKISTSEYVDENYQIHLDKVFWTSGVGMKKYKGNRFKIIARDNRDYFLIEDTK